MPGKFFKRITLFKVPKEEDIDTILKQYEVLRRTAQKDGKPYIISNEAAKTVNASEERARGYTICVQTTFASQEDCEYYDKHCEAHQALKGVVTPRRTDYATMLFESDLEPADLELSAKLGHERQLEVDSRDPKEVPQDLKEYLGTSEWKVEDKSGTEVILLTKQFGNETIRIECNISDMNAEQEIDELDDDVALQDEEEFGTDVTSGGRKTINQSGVKGGKIDIAPEDSIAPSERDEEFAEGQQELNSYPLNLNITIEKKGKGATSILARSQDGEVEIEYVYFYPRAELVDPKTAELAKESADIYGGPPFQHLDVELQAMYDTYIQERGINADLLNFIARYVDFKEQREYVQWLENMKTFVDA